MKFECDRIRNFAIIAHIDHGKSTIADRFIQTCGALTSREMSNQVLDSMEIEQERGITIKAQAIRLFYKSRDFGEYQLNLIDTPGHVDFSYEVSRSLAACEGALLVVDAAQGVEAQTVAVCNTAINQGLEILPVFNKCDLPQADPERIRKEIEEIMGIPSEHAVEVSGKSGKNIDLLLNTICQRIPAPTSRGAEMPLQALIIDSWFDNYLGVVSLIRIREGELRIGDRIRIFSTERHYQVEHLGYFSPKRIPTEFLATGEVGFLVANIKEIHGAPVGDTITLVKNPCLNALQGFIKVKPRVFAGFFPTSNDEYNNFRIALEKLSLNDASLFYEPELSTALGSGFRCGFLGLLHMEIIQERLEREYDLDLISTAPTVIFEVQKKNGERVRIDNPSQFTNLSSIEKIFEPIVEVTILTPNEYIGAIMKICNERRSKQKEFQYHGEQVLLSYHLPMSEVVADLFDTLQSVSRGYASLDYNMIGFQEADLVRLDILLNGERIDALATIVHRSVAFSRGRNIAEKLKETIPRQQYDVAIQAAIGGQIIARATVKAVRKDVTAKCYGGDVTRKNKLLDRQKRGKRRLKNVGKIVLPQKAFFALLSGNNEGK